MIRLTTIALLLLSAAPSWATGRNLPFARLDVEDGLSHAGHDPHVHDHVRAVGELDADLGDG